MKYLRGLKKRYYKLSVIAVYSTIHKLFAIDSKYIYHKRAFEYDSSNKDPPIRFLNFT